MKFEDLKIGDEIMCVDGDDLIGIPVNGTLLVVLLHYSQGSTPHLLGVEAQKEGSTDTVFIPTYTQSGYTLVMSTSRQTKESLQALINACKFKDWIIALRFDGERPYVQIQFKDKDNFGTKEEMQYGRKWMLSYHMCDTEVVRTVKKAIDAAMQHEVDENFKYNGRSIFNPHRNIQMLWIAAGGENSVDLRK